MRINDITIKNFRGFENKSFSFDPKMNVVLGDNTAGKTTLLHAVQIALSAYIKSLTIISCTGRNFAKSDFVKVYSNSSKSFLRSENKPRITTNAIFSEHIYKSKGYQNHDSNVKWILSTEKKINYLAELSPTISTFEYYRRHSDESGEISILPLMVAFGASRLENKYNGVVKSKERPTREENGYKNAFDEKVDFKSAFDWIYRFEKELAKDKEFEGTDTAFIQALLDARPAIKDIDIDRKNNEFVAQIQMTNDPQPRWLTYDMMSDGFKAMINIVADISYRCIQLNGFLGVNAVKETPGIVMIDEVELYLHPHWQQHILTDLQAAFPKIQFIVTSHSPFIVQSVESKNVITLDGEKGSENPQNRGVEEISAHEMGMQDALRSQKYKQKYELAEKYFQLVKEGREGRQEIDKVKKELNDLELKFSLITDPAYEAFLRINRGNL